MKTQVHITPHMHWDREWYFTTEESRILLVNNMEEIMTRLENDPDYRFYLLDGQTAILEDYLAVVPHNEGRLKTLVETGRLIVGPWYSQTDTMQVAGESIVRNMLYGLRDSRRFGEPMMIGYLPDSFAMSSQLPAIYNGFRIDRTIFWRGCSERHGTDKTEFRWQSNDGSEVTVQVLPLGYAIGKYLPDDDDGLRDRLDKYFPVLEKPSVTNHILLPNGHDQMPVQQDIFPVMERLRRLYPDHDFNMSRYEEVFEEIEAMKESLDTITGEFNDGRYMRVHRTISSTRMDIKIAHAEIENKIVNLLEPLCAIAWSQGFDWHHGLLEKMWKEILKNHAHDSIGCCCSDQVHREIMARFLMAGDMADHLLRFTMRKIADNAERREGIDTLTLFNMAPHPRTEVVRATIRIRAQQFSLTDGEGNAIPFFIEEAHEIDPGLVDRQIVHYGNYDPFMEFRLQFPCDLPAMGYTTLFINPEESAEPLVQPQGDERLENEFYRIDLNPDGTLRITEKATGQVYDRVLELEDGSDDGDEYDYSPLPADWLLSSTKSDMKIQVEHQPFQSIARIHYRMAVPKNLDERRTMQTSGHVEVQAEVVLQQGSRRIDISLKLDNQADDHRLRALIPTPFAPQSVVADNQFGTISRPVEDEAMANWRAEGWKEAPVPVWQLMNFAALEENGHGLALFTNGLREFEVVARPQTGVPEGSRNTFALTLFRSVGVLGKEKLYLRPGRPSGIKLPCPDSQMRGKLTCTFSLFAYEGSHAAAGVMNAARDCVTPVQVYNMNGYNAMKLNLETHAPPHHFSLLSLAEGPVLSALKKAEDEEALIVRLYNPGETAELPESAVNFTVPLEGWQETWLDEQVKEGSAQAGKIAPLAPCEVKSYRATIRRSGEK